MVKELNYFVSKVKLDDIEPPKFDIRAARNSTRVQEIKASIKTIGLLEPLLVRPLSTGKYELVDGYNRFIALKELGYDEAPVIIREIPDEEVVRIAVHENIKRHNLTPLDVARTAKKLMEENGMTLEDAARYLGLSKATVSKAITVDDALDFDSKKLLQDGKMTFREAYFKVASRRRTKPRMRMCGGCGRMFEDKDLKPIWLCISCMDMVVQKKVDTTEVKG